MMYGGPPPNVSSDLPVLFGACGIRYSPDKVGGDNNSATQVQLQNGSLAREPVWLSLNRADFNSQSLATAQLGSMLFVESGSVEMKPGSRLVFTPLVQTSAQAGEVDTASLQFAQPDDVASHLVTSGRKTIAALANIRQVSDNLAKTSDRLEHFVSDNEPGVSRFTHQSLPELEQLLRESRQAARDFRDLSRSLKQNPSQLIYEPNYRGVEVAK